MKAAHWLNLGIVASATATAGMIYQHTQALPPAQSILPVTSPISPPLISRHSPVQTPAAAASEEPSEIQNNNQSVLAYHSPPDFDTAVANLAAKPAKNNGKVPNHGGINPSGYGIVYEYDDASFPQLNDNTPAISTNTTSHANVSNPVPGTSSPATAGLSPGRISHSASNQSATTPPSTPAPFP